MFNFQKEPGKELKIEKILSKEKPLISVIVPFYNDGAHITQTIYSILNQTFPLFELFIINDGSTDRESIEKLKEIELLDSRIKVFHKENTGVSKTRDYGAKQASESSKYFVFCDSDDLLEPNYLELCFLSLETHPNAGWAYTNSVGFESMEYEWNCHFDSEIMKYDNLLVLIAMIRKDVFWEVNGFSLEGKNMYEDWNLWLKLLSKKFFPLHLSYYGSWYRRKENGEFQRAKTSNHKKAFQVIKKTRKELNQKVNAIEFPIALNTKKSKVIKPLFQYNEPFSKLFLLETASEEDVSFYNTLAEKERIIVVFTFPKIHHEEQFFHSSIQVFCLSEFLELADWDSFIEYLKVTRNVEEVITKVDYHTKEYQKRYQEACMKYYKFYDYPEAISFFETHYKLYKWKVKLDFLSRKLHCYKFNIWLQKQIYKLLKRN